MDPGQQDAGGPDDVVGMPAEVGARPTWASSFPGPELDELRARLTDEPPTTPDGMADLLDAVGAEAGRLRATMLRMVSERLVTAEEDAARILREALEEATRTRGEAVRTMTERLREAEGAAEAIRRTALEDNRRAKRKALPLLTSAVAQVENLRDEMARLFDAADGLVPSLGQAASHVRQLIGDVDAQFPEPSDGEPTIGGDPTESPSGYGTPEPQPEHAAEPANGGTIHDAATHERQGGSGGYASSPSTEMPYR
jgi:hypothetical protein